MRRISTTVESFLEDLRRDASARSQSLADIRDSISQFSTERELFLDKFQHDILNQMATRMSEESLKIQEDSLEMVCAPSCKTDWRSQRRSKAWSDG